MQHRGLSHRRRVRRPRGAFTLVELLVVIGLIVLLVGLALPAVLHSLRVGRRTRTVSDFQLISMALEAYKQDFGDYPRFDSDHSTDSLNVQQDRGARLLCRSLLAPAAATVSIAGTVVGFNALNSEQAPDGADGYGFRTRPGGAGKVYGPYIQSDKFVLGNPGAPMGKYDSTYFTDATLLDPEGNPILYYPATPGVTNITGQNNQLGTFVANYSPTLQSSDVASAPSTYPMYNAYDNLGYGSVAPPTYLFMKETELQYLMGERSSTSQLDGIISNSATPPERATTTQAYLLWSAGEDGIYGRKPVPGETTPSSSDKTDDVTNFDLPSDVVKQ